MFVVVVRNVGGVGSTSSISRKYSPQTLASHLCKSLTVISRWLLTPQNSKSIRSMGLTLLLKPLKSSPSSPISTIEKKGLEKSKPSSGHSSKGKG